MAKNRTARGSRKQPIPRKRLIPRPPRQRLMPSNAAPLDPLIPVPEWYGLNGFSRSTGERIIAAGEIEVVRIGKRLRGIRQTENERWRQSRVVQGGGK